LNLKSVDIIEKYDMVKIEKTLKYNREMLVVLGLLLGCDYDSKGVPGCGKEMARNFLNEINEANESIDIFDVIRKWSTDKNKKYSKYEEKVRKLALEHAKTEKKSFPDENIINEYMSYSKITQIILSEDKYLTIKWNRPNLNLFQVINLIHFSLYKKL
jgi:hypothetical protein